MNETWKDIPDFEGRYQASNLGGLRSVDRDVLYSDGIVRHHKGIILRPNLSKRGYRSVMVADKTHKVASLIAITFLGPRPDGAHVHHINRDRSDDRAENLVYVTREEHDKVTIHDRSPRGESHYGAKIYDREVEIIKRMYATGKLTHKEIAEIFSVDPSTITRIVTGERRSGH